MYYNDDIADESPYSDPALILEMMESNDTDFDDDTTQEEINMAAQASKKTDTAQQAREFNPIDGLHALLGTVTQYPLQNVLQRMMQQMVTEIARAQHLADRIEVGDEPMYGNQTGMRPQIDQDQYERTLSERQLEILVNCQNDEAELVNALVQIKGYYTWLFHEDKVTYAIQENGRGGWDQLTDFKQAVNAEYRKAHQNWLKRQNTPQSQEFSPEGAQAIREAAKARADKLASSL